MNYLTIDGNPVSFFEIAQAHAQLEADYNIGGWLRERPSNRRRLEATSVQLNRIHYRAGPMAWVEICEAPPPNVEKVAAHNEDEGVRYIYCANVLKWNLPMDSALALTIERVLPPAALSEYAARLEMAKETGYYRPGQVTEDHPQEQAPAP